MLHSFKRILNSTLHATDGKIGHLDDLLFDDQMWVVRYIVVRTGGLLNRHRVLISPLGVARVDWEKQSLSLGLTRQQIEESPDVDTDEPLFRQMEKRYFDYYSWPYYWNEMSVWGIDPRNSVMAGEAPQEGEATADPHLRSFREVTRYDVNGDGESLGRVADVIFDDDAWFVRYLVAEIGSWWPENRLLVDPAWIRTIDWVERCVKLLPRARDVALNRAPSNPSNSP